jgi:hypothetical protein
VIFNSPSVVNGNATVSIAGASFCPPPSAYRFALIFNGTVGPAGEFASSGNYTSLSISNVSFHVYWTDVDRQGLVNVGDTFVITGDGTPLPPRSDITFFLTLPDMTEVQEANWRST